MQTDQYIIIADCRQQSALNDRVPPVGLQAGQMRFGADGFKLLVVFDGPFGAAANFKLLEQLQFAFGFEEVCALLSDLTMKLLAASFERGGAALNVGLEIRQGDVIFARRGRGVADVCACFVELCIERTNLVVESLTGGQQVSKLSAFRFGLLAA
jgi:hypothetical protein